MAWASVTWTMCYNHASSLSWPPDPGPLFCQVTRHVSMWRSHMLWHLQCGIGSVDEHHELQEERPPKNAVVPDVETGYLKHQHLLALVAPDPQDTSRSMRLIGVDDCPGMIP
jgi:hypothetical protein